MREGLARIEVKWTGLAPLIMHRGELANPFDFYAQQMKTLSGKKKKTLEQLKDLADVEWMGSLYYDKTSGVNIPADNIIKAIIEGARKRKMGKQVESSVFVDEDAALIYSGPNDPKELMKVAEHYYQRTIRVQASRIVRTRPKFNTWAIAFPVDFDDQVIDRGDLIDAMKTAVSLVGLGDWRPRFGTFKSEVLK
jgi:hypothetical protein